MKKMYLPFVSLEDMFNAQIASISFPGVQTTPVNQGLQNYQLTKRGGKQLDQTMSKQFTLTVKLSESYMTYFMARQQFELFNKIGEGLKELYMSPISVTLLDDSGFSNITYTYYQLTPIALSDYELSYAAKPGNFTTFTWTFAYNYFEIWYTDTDGRFKREQIDTEYGMLKETGYWDTSKYDDGYMTVSANNSRSQLDKVKGSMLHNK